MSSVLSSLRPVASGGMNMVGQQRAAGCQLVWAARTVATAEAVKSKKKFPLVIVGGGAGGCSVAANFVGKVGKGNVAIIEPRDTHYYQPYWTLVGGGQKKFENSGKPMGEVLPSGSEWIKDKVVTFDPDARTVTTAGGEEIEYEYLVVAMGLQLHYNKIKGLPAAFDTPGVGSNYDPRYVRKTWAAIENFQSGNAIFTFPNTPVKCAGAPQKIMYLTERILNKTNRRGNARIMYHTSLPVLFGVKKYADALWKLVEERGIEINTRSNLVEVDADRKVAYFQDLDNESKDPVGVEYSMLHVTPPMGPPELLKTGGAKLTDQAGFVDVEKFTLQHKKYPNVFGIGDCTNVPCAKTAAAVAAQLAIVRTNMEAVMDGKELTAKYDGYTSCPLVTGPGEAILAEFDFQAPPQPLETFPFDQGKPRWSMYGVKAHLVPTIYWQMLKGRWIGPSVVRKILHLGMTK